MTPWDRQERSLEHANQITAQHRRDVKDRIEEMRADERAARDAIGLRQERRLKLPGPYLTRFAAKQRSNSQGVEIRYLRVQFLI